MTGNLTQVGAILSLMGGSAYKGSPCYKRSAGLHRPNSYIGRSVIHSPLDENAAYVFRIFHADARILGDKLILPASPSCGQVHNGTEMHAGAGVETGPPAQVSRWRPAWTNQKALLAAPVADGDGLAGFLVP